MNESACVVERARLQPDDSPLSGFQGPPVLPRATVLYLLALAAVAAVMAMLPVVYLAILGLVVWAVAWHAVHNPALVHGWVGGLVYLAPIVAGAVLAFFMLKPFFAKRAPGPPRFSLAEASEPVLAAFVSRLCRELHAPRPVRVDLDDQANASAAFEGGWRGFLGGRVVLTIGLPLVAGMTLQQLTGVLAHEFGHFAQGAGMRLTRIIRAINVWFARVAYERDEWDARLEAWSKNSDFRIAAMLLLARVCIGATRFVLKLLMFAGHAVSCLLLRQMEFDADRHQCAVTGSEAFEPTARRVQELSFSRTAVQADLQRGWNEDRLPDDLPLLVARRFETAGPDVRRAVDKSVSEGVTSLFDTHPATVERVRAARAARDPGIFHATQPASTLFADFPACSRQFTRFYFEQVLGLSVLPSHLVPSASYLEPLAAADARAQAVRQFFGDAGQVWLYPLPVPESRPRNVDVARALCQVDAARHCMEELSPHAVRAVERFGALDGDLCRLAVAGVLAEAGIPVRPHDVGVVATDLEGTTHVSEGIARARSRVDAEALIVAADLDRFRRAATDRLSAALHVLADRSATSTIGDAEAVVAEAARFVAVLNVLHAENHSLRKVRLALQALAVIGRFGFGDDPAGSQVAGQVSLGSLSLGNSARPAAGRLLERLRTLPAPPGDDSHETLADVVIAATGWHASPGPPADLFNVFEHIARLEGESLGRLLELTETAVAAARADGPVAGPSA